MESRESIEGFAGLYERIRSAIAREMIGQEQVVENLLLCLIAGGNVLLEGVPGLGKTHLVRTLSHVLDLPFSRVQFTPDLMPTDITGTHVLERNGEGTAFVFRRGPLFASLVLADEINRATPKTQSALLEAMQERQVTIGETTFKLPEPFLVMATQNPIEQEGTYPLPEAQLDRFLMHVRIGFPDAALERQILQLARGEAQGIEPQIARKISQDSILAARQEVLALFMAEAVEEYLIQLVMATRRPELYSPQLAEWLQMGASPRGTIALDRCARAHAWLAGRDFVSPEDVQAVVHDVLRHRLILSFEAEAAGIDADRAIALLMESVAVV